jgi:hypothetical protein
MKKEPRIKAATWTKNAKPVYWPLSRLLRLIDDQFTYQPRKGKLICHNGTAPHISPVYGDFSHRVMYRSPKGQLSYVRIQAVRIAHYLGTGEWSTARFIRLIDEDPTNLKLSNLLPAGYSQHTSRYYKLRGDFTSQYKGVSCPAQHQKKGRWTAKICHQDRPFYLGSFDTEEDAAVNYNIASLELRGDFGRLNPCRAPTEEERRAVVKLLKAKLNKQKEKKQ